MSGNCLSPAAAIHLQYYQVEGVVSDVRSAKPNGEVTNNEVADVYHRSRSCLRRCEV